jgi:hypothetical protein
MDTGTGSYLLEIRTIGVDGANLLVSIGIDKGEGDALAVGTPIGK